MPGYKLNENRKIFSAVPIDYIFLVLTGILLLLGLTILEIVPSLKIYRVSILSFLAGLAITAIGNLIVGFIQKGVSAQAAKYLDDPLKRLEISIEKFRLFEEGIVGVFANRSAAMARFKEYIKIEDKTIDFVGTSLLGTIDPDNENVEKVNFLQLLMTKKYKDDVKIRALLMHPAYGEFRERVENRGRAAVAIDIQKTLKYLIKKDEKDESRLLDSQSVRLYPGVITAFAIFTSRAMLVNVSALYGPVFDNFTIIVEDTNNPNSIYKKFKANHFEEPWRSEKTIRIDGDKNDNLLKLCSINFALPENRFKEGNWPFTIKDENIIKDENENADDGFLFILSPEDQDEE